MGIDVLSTAEGCSSRAGMINLSSQTCNSMIQRSLHVGCPIITRMLHYPNEVYVLHPPSRSFRIVLVSGACLIFIEGILCIMLIRYEKINNTWNSYVHISRISSATSYAPKWRNERLKYSRYMKTRRRTYIINQNSTMTSLDLHIFQIAGKQ